MAADNEQKSQSYNRFKEHNGKQYSGMPVGRAHKWYYDRGEWRERKVTPDEWEISYQTTKRRAAQAPDKSGAPVGTEYNWLIVSHQRVDKLDANSYMTCMEGKKFKVAHKRASNGKWSASEQAQRRQVIKYLEQVIAELKAADDAETLPYSVGEHNHVYGFNLKTKAELLEMARDHNIQGTSRMKREELLEAVKRKVYESRTAEQEKQTQTQTQTTKKTDGDGQRLHSRSRDELYKLASEFGIGGRSKMTKAELAVALANEVGHSGLNPGA